jgi:histidinol phosphatase-like PHP family hydrolase
MPVLNSDIARNLEMLADLHGTSTLGFMRFAADQARRGWSGPADILNPRSRDDLRAGLQCL